ncbi:hypothetical protein AWZ03_015375, partial [Drosophila navojoa]
MGGVGAVEESHYRTAAAGVPGTYTQRGTQDIRLRQRHTICEQKLQGVHGISGVTLQYTTPYSPQENPTERTNRTVKTMIAQYIEGHQSSWDELVPEITLAVNSSVADSTGFTPAFLMLGREPRLPA